MMTNGEAKRAAFTPAVVCAAGAVILALVLGGFTARPDVVAVALPFAAWLGFVWRPRPVSAERVEHEVIASSSEPGHITSRVLVETDAEWAQVSALTPTDRQIDAVMAPGETLTVHTRLSHSGPTDALTFAVRAGSQDAGLIWPALAKVTSAWDAHPAAVSVRGIPLPRRLPGLHGAHGGTRVGAGGDFRDLHPYAAGDDFRRVDWRATARSTRGPADFQIRRTYATSDVPVVLVIDTADDLGARVGLWGTRDPERGGETSLDRAREAARSVAEAATEAGDRIAFIELAMRGRIVRAGSGRRHLAHVTAAIAATSPRSDDETYQRTPPVPPSSTIVVLSTFFDGDAQRLALTWAAGGHRVIGIDTLPPPDMARLTPERRFTAELVFAERREVLRNLRTAGVDVIGWDSTPGVVSTRFAQLARRPQ